MNLVRSAVAVVCSVIVMSAFPFAVEHRPSLSGKHENRIFASLGTANILHDPVVFSSSKGELNILMAAKPKGISLSRLAPTAWVYEICLRKDAVGDTCPADSRTANPYG